MCQELTSTTDNEQLEEKLQDLCRTIKDNFNDVSLSVEGGDVNEKFENVHNVTIKEYLDTVRLLTEQGMTFSASRTYAMDMFSKHAVLGTDKYTEYQAKVTGVSEKAYNQLLNEAEKQINDIIKLRYSVTSDRPLEVVATQDISGFSDYEKGEYSSEMNPTHHRMIVYVCKYILDPSTSGEYSHNEKCEDELPKYAVFFEKYTGNGVLDTSRNLDEQGTRLHSIESSYCYDLDEVEQSIWSKLKYVDRQNELDRLMHDLRS